MSMIACVCVYMLVFLCLGACMFVCVCVWACLLQGGGLVPIAFLSVLISVYSMCLNTCFHLLIMLYVHESTYFYMTTFVCHVFVMCRPIMGLGHQSSPFLGAINVHTK